MKTPASKDIVFVGIQRLLFALYLYPIWQWSFQPNHFLKYTFLLLACIGLLVVALAILQLKSNLTPFPTPKFNGTLVQAGMYKFVRHPIYSGIILLTISLGFYQGSLLKIVIGISLWILFFFKSKYEESLLCRHFNKYENYMKNTNRFFPFL